MAHVNNIYPSCSYIDPEEEKDPQSIKDCCRNRVRKKSEIAKQAEIGEDT